MTMGSPPTLELRFDNRITNRRQRDEGDSTPSLVASLARLASADPPDERNRNFRYTGHLHFTLPPISASRSCPFRDNFRSHLSFCFLSSLRFSLPVTSFNLSPDSFPPFHRRHDRLIRLCGSPPFSFITAMLFREFFSDGYRREIPFSGLRRKEGITPPRY